MMRLLLTGSHQYAEHELAQLKSLGYELVFQKDEKAELSFDPATIDAVVCTNLFMYHDVLHFENLKRIQLTSVGMDRVPVEAIRSRGIALFNAGGVYSAPIAEWVVLMILEVYKKSRVLFAQQNQHIWEKQRRVLELTGKTATIVGYGSIGREVAKRLKSFDVHVIGVHRRPVDLGHADELIMIRDLDQALAMSDIVVLTIPLTEETRNLFDSERLSRIQSGAVLVNVSRGAVIDETALVEAIRAGHFLGVALDVFEEEPLKAESPLWDMENVIVTPHNSFVSDRVNDRLFELMVKNLEPV